MRIFCRRLRIELVDEVVQSFLIDINSVYLLWRVLTTFFKSVFDWCQTECFSAIFHRLKMWETLAAWWQKQRGTSSKYFLSLHCSLDQIILLLSFIFWPSRLCKFTFINIICNFLTWSRTSFFFVLGLRELKAIKVDASRQSVQQIMWLSSHDKNVHNVNSWLRRIWYTHLWVNHDNFQSTMKGKLCKTFHGENFFYHDFFFWKNYSYLGCVQSLSIGGEL